MKADDFEILHNLEERQRLNPTKAALRHAFGLQADEDAVELGGDLIAKVTSVLASAQAKDPAADVFGEVKTKRMEINSVIQTNHRYVMHSAIED